MALEDKLVLNLLAVLVNTQVLKHTLDRFGFS